MRFLKIKLENYARIYNGLGGRTELEIDLSNARNTICVISGPNGVGKSTLLNAISLMPDKRPECPGTDASKTIDLTDGTDLYHILITNSRTGVTKGYISKNGKQLNPNGNITTYKEIVYAEFDIDQNFLDLCTISGNNRGIADKTPAERRKLIGPLISSIEVYNNMAKQLNKKANIFKSYINTTSEKIKGIGSRDNLTMSRNMLINTISNINAEIKKKEDRITILNSQTDSEQQRNAEALRIHESLLEDICIKDKELLARVRAIHAKMQQTVSHTTFTDPIILNAIKCVVDSLKDKIDHIGPDCKLEGFISVVEELSYDIENERKLLEDDQRVLDRKIAHISENENEIRTLKAYSLPEYSGVEENIEKFKKQIEEIDAELEAIRNELFSEPIFKYVARDAIINGDCDSGVNWDQILVNLNLMITAFDLISSYHDTITFDLDPDQLKTPIESDRLANEQRVAIDIAEDRKYNLLHTKGDIEGVYERASSNIRKIPDKCFASDDRCELITSTFVDIAALNVYQEFGVDFINTEKDLDLYSATVLKQNALIILESTKKNLDQINADLDEVDKSIADMNKCLESLEKENEAANQIHRICRKVSDETLTTLCLFLRSTCGIMNKSTAGDDMYTVAVILRNHNLVEQTKAKINSIMNDLKVSISNTRKFNDLSEDLDKLEKIKEQHDSTMNIIKQLEKEITRDNQDVVTNTGLLRTFKSNISVMEEVYRDAKEAVALLQTMEENLKQEKSIADRVNEFKKTFGTDVERKVEDLSALQKEVTELVQSRDPLDQQLSTINSQLILLDSYEADYTKYKTKYDYINIVRKYCNPSQASIQSLFMSIYMNKTLDVVNQLLGMIFEGRYRILDYIFDDGQFRIPFIGNGLIVDDISSGSTSQVCMMGMIINMVLANQGSQRYNIIPLDEIDGGLDTYNRAVFVDVLNKMCDILNIGQLFIISHSVEATLVNVDSIILTNDPKQQAEYHEMLSGTNILYE